MRAFIATDIPLAIQNSIQQQVDRLQKVIGIDPVRWVSAHNLHLTWKFLGDVSPANINILTQLLRTTADSHSVFDISISGLGSFPSPKRARVLFIGIQAPAESEALHSGIETACARVGYEPDSHPFSPHLTIGRVKQGIPLTDRTRIFKALEEIKIDSLGRARVDFIHLYKSELKPTGPVYTKLFSAPLTTEVKPERT